MKLDLDRLPALINRVAEGIVACRKVVATDEAGRAAYRRAVADLCADLTQDAVVGGAGATIVSHGDGIRVVLAGIRAHSTTGEIGALNNWLMAARDRLEGGRK